MMNSNNNQDIFNVKDTINHLFQNWWKITLLGIIFGLLGLGFSFVVPPKYQAEAIFSATIDYSQINFENLTDNNGKPLELTQYDYDLALSVIQRVLMRTRKEAIQFAQTLDPTLDSATFVHNSLIERQHDRWYLRYRHQDPSIAQSIVNHWAMLGEAKLRKDQEANKVEPFVLADWIAPAYLPNRPIYKNRNSLVLAGVLIGLCIGIFAVDFKDRFHPTAKPGG